MEILVEGQLDYFEEKSWKKRYFVMKYEISSALRYIEIYKDKNWQKQLPRHVVNLHPGYEVKRREEPKKKHCFAVRTTDHTLILASEDENIITHWMSTLEEYNLVKSFCVQPQDTPTMAKIEAVFPCHLQLVHSEVRLVSAMDGKILGMWPFKCIRRYKFVGNLFSIEAGRKAPTGEGIFEFISNECSEIYRVMDTIIRTKAGNTTMRRFASEKIQNQVVQPEREPLRKVNSIPPSPKKDTPPCHYDYAAPVPTNRPAPPPVPLHSPPQFPPPTPEPTYDILSPGLESNAVDGKLPKQDGTPTNGNEYNTLQFSNARPKESQSPIIPKRAPKMTGSPGSYDTLAFTDNTANGHETLKAKARDGGYDTVTIKGDDTLKSRVGNYDTLQFNERRDTSVSVNSIQGTKNEIDDKCQNSFDSVYNMLDHSSGSIGSVGSMSSNTYDSLQTGTLTNKSGGSDTYDSLNNCNQETRPQPPTSLSLSDNVYDAIQHDKKQTVKDLAANIPKPVTPPQGVHPTKPSKPPPRRKPPTPTQAHVRKISASKLEKPDIQAVPSEIQARKPAGLKPDKPIKTPRKNAAVKENKDELRPKCESISDVIQKRLANPKVPVDDRGYASVDHEYSSIDYSKMSKSGNTDSSSDLYAEPNGEDARNIPIPKPTTAKAPAKPARSAVKPTKKDKKLVGGRFADELKKKLENKLKKTGGNKPVSTSQTGQSGTDDDIYCEVDYSQGHHYSNPDTYSEPSAYSEPSNYSEPEPYSEPDPYSEPAV